MKSGETVRASARLRSWVRTETLARMTMTPSFVARWPASFSARAIVSRLGI
jgi:hypothetical protein